MTSTPMLVLSGRRASRFAHLRVEFHFEEEDQCR